MGDDYRQGAPIAATAVGPHPPSRTAPLAVIRESSPQNRQMTRHTGGCVEARRGGFGKGARRRAVGVDLDSRAVSGCAVGSARPRLGGGRDCDGERRDTGREEKALHAMRIGTRSATLKASRATSHKRGSPERSARALRPAAEARNRGTPKCARDEATSGRAAAREIAPAARQPYARREHGSHGAFRD